MEKNKYKYKNKNIYDISYSMRKARWHFIRSIVLGVLLFYLFLNLLMVFCISPIKQKSRSMEPSIKNNSYSFSTPCMIFSKVRRGEIVLVKRQEEEPISIVQKSIDIICRALTFQKFHPFTRDNYFLSRVAAMPGDTIFMKDFVLYIMPKDDHFSYTEFELNQVPYSIDIRVPPAGWNTKIGVRGNFEKVTLSPNEYFVLADNRLSSMDSRIFGAINEKNIKRKILITYFPFSAFKLFRPHVKK